MNVKMVINTIRIRISRIKKQIIELPCAEINKLNVNSEKNVENAPA
jgi:hypothetical protein